jgi:hypothetical protein
VLIALVIALPMAAYVAGSLVASSSEQPTRREPVIVRDAPEPDTGTGSPTSDPSRPPDDDPDDDPDDEQDDDDGEQDDDRIRKVTPAPTRVGTMMTTGTTPTTEAGATMTTGATTTERSSRLRPPARFSVRTRLTVAVALLTASALTGAGLLVWVLESARIDRAVNDRIDQEIAEFEQLHGGNDPETARPFDDVTRLLEVFLSRNVADNQELLLGYDAGSLPSSTVDDDDPRLAVLDDPGYLTALAQLRPEGGTRTLDSADLGDVW